MTWREIRVQQTLKMHDPDLFLNRSLKGTYQVMRKGRTVPHYVFSLTDNWRPDGTPVEWGLEPLGKKLRECDSWNPHSLFSRMEKINAKVDESKKRDFDNKTEDFLRDWRPQFAKAFNDVNTANMDKKLDRRRLKDGNRKS